METLPFWGIEAWNFLDKMPLKTHVFSIKLFRVRKNAKIGLFRLS